MRLIYVLVTLKRRHLCNRHNEKVHEKSGSLTKRNFLNFLNLILSRLYSLKSYFMMRRLHPCTYTQSVADLPPLQLSVHFLYEITIRAPHSKLNGFLEDV